MGEWIIELKKVVVKVGKKGCGFCFVKLFVIEFFVFWVEKERERDFLKKENVSFKI